MKKALAIILCVVMLLPSFTFLTSADATYTTWDEYAAGHPSYQLTQIATTQEAPTVDGVISSGEYSTTTGSWIDLTQFETDVPAVNGTSFYGTPETANMYINETESRIYFAFEFTYGAGYELNGQDEDFRFCISPQYNHNIPASYCNTTPMQMFLEYNTDGTFYTSPAQSTHITDSEAASTRDTENEKLYYEFSVLKSELERRFIGTSDMVGFTFGAWFYHYEDNTERFGYGWEMVKDASAAGTPVTKFDAHSGWDDQWLYVKLADNPIEDVNTWEELAAYGLPVAITSPTTAAPSVDGTVNASEYTSKLRLTTADTSDTRAAAAIAAGAFPAYIDTYFTSDETNIYIALDMPKTSGFDASDVRLLADFTDGSNIYRPYITKLANGSGTKYRNYKIAALAETSATTDNVNLGTFNSTYQPIVEWDNSISNDRYTVEFVLSKAIVKLEYGLKTDITYMNFGIWLPSVSYNGSSYRVCYGANSAAKTAASSAAKITLTENTSYDLDDGIAVVKFTDANTYGGLSSHNLTKYGQLVFHANNPTTVDNAIDGAFTEGEYAFDYTFRSMRSGGTKSQWGVSLGNGALAPAHAKIFMDYDNEYFYLGLKIKDTNFVPRYCGAGAQYNYTEEVDPETGDPVLTPEDVIAPDSTKSVYDFYKVQISFNNTGSIFDAAEELELQFYLNADINNDANADGIAQAEELTPGFHVKSLVAGAEAPLAGMGSAWSYDSSKLKVGYTGEWNAETDELIFEVKLSRAEIAKAYGLDTLNNTIGFRMNHVPWAYTGNVGFDDVAGDTSKGIATAGGGGNGLKVYTAYWDGTTWLNDASHQNYVATLKAELVGDSEEPYMTSGDYGHIVVLGSEKAATPVNTTNGASVRFTEGSTGMRFKTLVSKTYYDALIAKYGAENVAFGTLIAPADYVEAAGAFTKEALTAKNPNAAGADYLDVRTSKAYAESDGAYTFLGSIANIKEVNYDREFAAIGYVEYTDGVNTYVVYSESYTVRSVEEVATMALNDFTTDATGACGYTVANTEIVAGKTVYTPYTDDQRTIAKKFVA